MEKALVAMQEIRTEEMVGPIIDRVRAHLLSALDFPQCDWTMRQVFEGHISGLVTLHAIYVNREHVATVASLEDDVADAIVILALGGSQLKTWAQYVFDQGQIRARLLGKSRILLKGRSGWHGVMTQLGFEAIYTAWQLDIKELEDERSVRQVEHAEHGNAK